MRTAVTLSRHGRYFPLYCFIVSVLHANATLSFDTAVKRRDTNKTRRNEHPDGSVLAVHEQGAHSYNAVLRRIYVVLLFKDLRLHLNRQSEQFDEALCVSLIVNVVFPKRCNFFGV